ncbi:hypothetical protein Ddye_029012 [Dipteronia dyeriana]|uniref:Uncharacterized protein n=1 Tax=Dipteronia dyeriana TaxID=168575 RepID=A0AAD9TDL3_9ROSI|nr:hypothetical protein Ddye_029012 [Dipteronia dyeriana]
MIYIGFLICGKSTLSIYFIGKLGKNELVGGSLSIRITSITGYILSYNAFLILKAIPSSVWSQHVASYGPNPTTHSCYTPYSLPTHISLVAILGTNTFVLWLRTINLIHCLYISSILSSRSRAPIHIQSSHNLSENPKT